MQLVERMERRVAALMTAESIIVAFLVVYGATVNETLVSWKKSGEPIFGTVFAGLLISALAITAFQSIYLLYRSIDISNPSDAQCSAERYRAGYDLFLMVILGSGFYVVINAFSILHFAMTGGNVPVPDEQLHISIAGSFLVAWLLLVVFIPLELTECIRSIRRRKWGNYLFAFLFVLLVCIMIMVEVVVLPRLLGFLPSYVWSVAFVLALVIAAAVLIVFGRRKRDRNTSPCGACNGKQWRLMRLV